MKEALREYNVPGLFFLCVLFFWQYMCYNKHERLFLCNHTGGSFS